MFKDMWNGPEESFVGMSLGKTSSYMGFMMESVKERDEEMMK